MLQVGKGKATTVNQHRTNFMIWAIAKSPLLLSTNLTALGEQFPTLMQLLLNTDVVAVNQDPLGVQARKIMVDGKPVGKPVGVEACARPDMMALSVGGGSGSGSGNRSVFGSMSEVEAAKQRWNIVTLPATSGSGGGGGGGGDGDDPRAATPTSSVVMLKHGFYTGRCLALQPPNPIA
jgi:hypothetical protein